MADILPDVHAVIPSPTSKYIEDSAPFYSDLKAPLVVYVEDNDDEPFWRRLFSCIADHYHRVQVFSLKTASVTSMAQYDTNGSPILATGKNPLMNKVTGLGKHMVVAVDADYDLLIDYHTYSDRIRSDKYVISTQYYSIENHLLTLRGIQALPFWQQLGEAVPQADLASILSHLADAVTNSVKLCVASAAHRQSLYKFGTTELPHTLQVDTIRSSLSSIQFTADNYQGELAKWQTTFEQEPQFVAMQQACQQELKTYDDWNQQDTLHHLQGHTLYNYLHQILLNLYDRGHKQLISTEKAKATDVSQYEHIVISVNERLGLTKQSKAEILEESIYNARSLDMQDPAIQQIEAKILAILS